jgi:hypothetical protein
LDNPAPNPTAAISTARPSTAMLKVLVPPGAAPGSTIHVQVPGEQNRILAARVPPHCSEFHVSYEPRQTTSSLAPPKDMVHAVGGLHAHAHAHAVPTQHPPSSSGPPTTKLVLVRVPPGTAPGTTLHVQVPGEPGRLLSAQVPSGNNVQEFHVSYQPRPTASPYGSGGMQQQQQQQQQQYGASSTYQSNQNRPQQYQNNGYQQQQQQSNNNGGWGSAVMPIAGGVATGVAAAMVYDHFAHHNNNSTQQQAYDNRDGDYGGDYDDYGGGGGDDYGGGDFGGGDY